MQAPLSTSVNTKFGTISLENAEEWAKHSEEAFIACESLVEVEIINHYEGFNVSYMIEPEVGSTHILMISLNVHRAHESENMIAKNTAWAVSAYDSLVESWEGRDYSYKNDYECEDYYRDLESEYEFGDFLERRYSAMEEKAIISLDGEDAVG